MAVSASRNPSSPGYRPHEVVSVQHELGAPLDDGPRVTGHQFLRPHPAADPVPRLQDHDLMTSLGDPVRGHQAREPGPGHHHSHARILSYLAMTPAARSLRARAQA
jgi:hypothetical protein